MQRASYNSAYFADVRVVVHCKHAVAETTASPKDNQELMTRTNQGHPSLTYTQTDGKKKGESEVHSQLIAQRCLPERLARHKVELTMQHRPCEIISKDHRAPVFGWFIRRIMEKHKEETQ